MYNNLYFIFYMVLFVPIIRKVKSERFQLLFFLIPLFFSLAFQKGIGVDYYVYIELFYFPTPRIEIGYKLYTLFLKWLSSNYRILFVGVSLLQVILLYNVVKKLKNLTLIKNISVFLFVALVWTSFYYELFNIFRGSIAALFFTLFILEYRNSKIKALLYFILSLTFHKSTLIVVFLFLMFNIFIKDKSYSKSKIIFFWLICITINRLGLIHKTAFFLYYIIPFDFKYKAYLISEHLYQYIRTIGIGQIVNFIIYTYMLCDLKKDEKIDKYYFNLGCLLFGLSFLFNKIPIFIRLIYGMNIFSVYFLYYLLTNQNKKYVAYLVIIFFTLQSFFSVFRQNDRTKKIYMDYKERYERILEYSSWLEDKEKYE